jgi:hypothetical protein
MTRAAPNHARTRLLEAPICEVASHVERGSIIARSGYSPGIRKSVPLWSCCQPFPARARTLA